MKRMAVAFVLLFFGLSLLSAQDYVFEQYDFAMDVALDNSYSVSEQIVANFSIPRHGIYREIPIRFGKVRVKLTDLTANEPIIEDSTSADYVTFRLGSADKTVVGRKEYRLAYNYAVGDDRNDSYDELYYNLIGPGWQAPIQNFTFRVTFPKPIDPSLVFLTGGAYGSTLQRGTYSISSDRRTITGKADNLQVGEALTLRVQMEQGYFSSVKPFVDYTIPVSVVVLLLALAGCVHATILFRRYGREALFVPVVRFEPPDELSPLEVGYLADGVVDNKDLTSMLFFWADQGCLRIEEQGKKEFLFTKIREPKTDKMHELRLFDAFFACGDGSSVTLKQLEQGKFAIALAKAKGDVRSYFKGERILKDRVAERKRVYAMLYGAALAVLFAIASTITYLAAETVLLMVVGFFSMVVTVLVASRLSAVWVISSTFRKVLKFFALALYCILMIVIAWVMEYYVIGNGMLYSVLFASVLVLVPAYLGFLTVVTAKRSMYAQLMLEQIVGYREFISKVEIDKLKMMIDTDPQLFYHVLGYAIVLGLEDTWAKKFASIHMPEPTWYNGMHPVQDALFYSVLSHRLHSTVMEHAIYPQARGGARSPILSSFGSSGFSGGGFGGGGGGAW